VCLPVGVYVRKVYCGKTGDWMRMPFGMVSGVGHGMGVKDGSPRAPSGRGGLGVGVPIHPISLNGVFLYAASKF